MLTRQRARTQTKPADRLFWSWLSRYWPGWRSTLVMVQPETIIRWHRTAWRGYWTWKSRARHPGRPRISKELQGLIARIATENPRWGAVRIQGELLALSYEVSAETVRCYRRRALRRPPSQSWRTFLANHRPQLWAADFFTVQTLTFKTLYVFFFFTHARRRIVHFNVTAHPTAPWVWRQLLEATPWGQQLRYLIRDRDRSYGGAFIGKARAIGIKTVLTAVRAPQANAIAERVVGTLRRECLDHLIIVNERHLRLVLREYVAHCNHVRPAPERGPSRGSADPGRAASRVRASRRVTFGRTTFSGSTPAATVTAPERGPGRGSADPGRAASRVRASRRVTFGRTTFSGSTAAD